MECIGIIAHIPFIQGSNYNSWTVKPLLLLCVNLYPRTTYSFLYILYSSCFCISLPSPQNKWILWDCFLHSFLNIMVYMCTLHGMFINNRTNKIQLKWCKTATKRAWITAGKPEMKKYFFIFKVSKKKPLTAVLHIGLPFLSFFYWTTIP